MEIRKPLIHSIFVVFLRFKRVIFYTSPSWYAVLVCGQYTSRKCPKAVMLKHIHDGIRLLCFVLAKHLYEASYKELVRQPSKL